MHLRRQTKVVTVLTLGAWLFALFVGIANACGWGDCDATSNSAVAATPSKKPSHDGGRVGCEQFCKTDVPVVSKVPDVADQPDLPPLVVTSGTVRLFTPLMPAFRRVQATYSPPDVQQFLRFARLRL